VEAAIWPAATAISRRSIVAGRHVGVRAGTGPHDGARRCRAAKFGAGDQHAPAFVPFDCDGGEDRPYAVMGTW
jgi:hypothetical protein